MKPSAAEQASVGAGAGAARPTALVFLSLIIGQLLNLAALSLLSAHLGLAGFGRFGICMLDFTIFAAFANFALPAASIAMAVKGRFRGRLFATAMGARLWTSAAALVLYLGFERAFREPGMFHAALMLAPALIFNPSQWDWWFAARQSWRDLLVHRILGGAVTLGLVLLGIRWGLDLPLAAAAYGAGFAAGAAYLIALTFLGGSAPRPRADLLPRPFPVDARMRYLWWKSLPISLTVVCEFLFIPLGFYAFLEFSGDGPLLGAYGSAYRIILAAGMLASSLFTVLLPLFAGKSDLDGELRRIFDRMALALAVPMLAVPFLARPVLLLFFPKTAWDPETLGFASWALAVMGLATYMHLLRMPPLTRALSEGRSWTYCRRFFIAGAANAALVALCVRFGDFRHLPLFALGADLIFTGWWLSTLYPCRGAAHWGRLGLLAAWAAGYLAWVRFWV